MLLLQLRWVYIKGIF